MAGSTKVALTSLRKLSISYAKSIIPSSVSRKEAYWAYLLFFKLKVGYFFPAISFTQTECNSIQAPALCGTLSKLHLNRNTARAIIFGPPKYGGLNLPDLYALRSAGQLTLLLRHIRAQDEVAKLIMIDISTLQLLTGSVRPVFDLPFPSYAKWIEWGLLVSIWDFLHKSKLRLFLRSAFCLSIPCQHDVSSMEAFLKLTFKSGVMR